MEKRELSATYKMLRKMGFDYSEEEYGQVSLIQVFEKFFGNIKLKYLEKKLDWAILEPILPRKKRAQILRKMGCHVGADVFIGDYVRVDTGHADMITIEDRVSIASGCRLLCHQRDFSNYFVGDDYMKLGYIIKPIILKKGCLIGMESFVMPGVTVGEGAVVGAGSMVTKDVPPYSVAIGRPAKVVRQFPPREEKEILKKENAG